ncbi:FadR/GntR family transcriptional regulator [Conexibacter arvalis]|uniref:DNA-binding FadR family transcriptional regulator n=1 Tax=Conexibacter arvalis TaxID=912552 RepID=A0A840IDE2_9ACTN|nr:FadR/GntR family transcriptional regulator [Conexibacter arvalis]MBB4662826.1 DNA-binding FadR family transcriptional regulator [Conexibacter arvalis]
MGASAPPGESARGNGGAAATRATTAYALRGLHGQVVDALGHRIVAGELSAGQTFDLVALERDLDVSRTVLREALKVLAAKGLVDARPKRGTFVRPRADWNLFDPDVLRWEFAAGPSRLFAALAEVRGIVEPATARLAADRRTDADLRALDAAFETMASADDAGDARAVVEADIAFHRSLAHASHNELLLPIQEVVLVGLRARDVVVHASRSPTSRGLRLHAAVIDAVRAQDADRAEAEMRALLAIAVRDSERAAD